MKARGLLIAIVGRRSLFAACCIAITASCAVYDADSPDGDTVGAGNGGTTIDGGGAGSGGSSTTGSGGDAGSTGGTAGRGGNGASVDGSAGTGGSNGGKGGAGSAGTGGVTGGSGGASGGGSSAGSGGASGGGSGGAGVGGTGGAGAGGDTGTGGTGGAATGGTDGGAGTGGTGVGGTGGAAGTGGTAGAGTTGGAAGAAGTGGSGTTAGTGGTTTTAGSGGTGGTAGTGGGKGGTGGSTIDAGPDLPPPPGAVFDVGSFTKSTATGTQTVTHTLGQTPKALIFWTVGKTNETLSAGYLYAFGASDGTETYSVGISSLDAAATSTTTRRMAQKAITLVQGGEVLVAEADLGALTASNFALNWTTNDATPAVIHYLAIGGPQVSANLSMWVSPTATGNKSITGVGFRPETVLHFYAGAAYLAPVGTTTFNGIFGLGAMDKNGNQWSGQVSDWDNNTTMLTSRGQQTDAAIFMYADGSQAAVTKEASFVSMDNDGFTVNFRAANANAGLICSLSLAGLKASAGTFNKVTAAAPISQSVTSTGFKPGAVLFSSYQMAPQSAVVSEANFSYGIGASDGTSEASSAITSADNVATSVVDAVDKTSKVLVKMNTPPEDAEADLTSLDATGFTLNWTTNDNVASQIGFWALGAP